VKAGNLDHLVCLWAERCLKQVPLVRPNLIAKLELPRYCGQVSADLTGISRDHRQANLDLELELELNGLLQQETAKTRLRRILCPDAVHELITADAQRQCEALQPHLSTDYPGGVSSCTRGLHDGMSGDNIRPSSGLVTQYSNWMVLGWVFEVVSIAKSRSTSNLSSDLGPTHL
jgi:hypothetical protein